MTIAKGVWPPKVAQVAVKEYYGRFSAPGGTGNLTATAGGRGISSVNYNSATGTYLITFDEVGENFLGAFFTVFNTAGTAAAQKVVNLSTYTASAKTLQILVSDLATPSLINFANGDQLSIHVVWADSDKP